MAKKPKPSVWYQKIITRHTPKKKVWRNCGLAFFSGGLLCALAETAHNLLISQAALSEDIAAAWVLLGVICLAALLTGCGWYDKAAQRLGAGLAVPISGFANSVTSAMLEHKYEGLVMGSGCNSFKLAGAVIVFSISSAFIVAVAMLIFGWL